MIGLGVGQVPVDGFLRGGEQMKIAGEEDGVVGGVEGEKVLEGGDFQRAFGRGGGVQGAIALGARAELPRGLARHLRHRSGQVLAVEDQEPVLPEADKRRRGAEHENCWAD